MIIRRSVRPRANFTMVRNVALRDRTISFRARGVLCYLLSLPDGGSCSMELVAKQSTEGRDAIRTALRELVAAGYAIRTKSRNLAGTWTWELTVYDDPQTVDNLGSPLAGNPSTVSQAITTYKTSYIRDDPESCELFTRAADCIDCNGGGYIETPNNNWSRCACSGIGQP